MGVETPRDFLLVLGLQGRCPPEETGRGPQGAWAGRGQRSGRPRPDPDRCRGGGTIPSVAPGSGAAPERPVPTLPVPRAGPDPARCEQRPAGSTRPGPAFVPPRGRGGGSGGPADHVPHRGAGPGPERACQGGSRGSAPAGWGVPHSPPSLGARFPPPLLPPPSRAPPALWRGKLARIAALNPKPQFGGFRPSPPSWGGRVRGWGASIGYALWASLSKKGGTQGGAPANLSPLCLLGRQTPPPAALPAPPRAGTPDPRPARP